MKYKIHLDALMCDKKQSKFIRACDLGITDVGMQVRLSFYTDKEPTNEYIQKIIDLHLSTEKAKELDVYFANVKLNRIELVQEG